MSLGTPFPQTILSPEGEAGQPAFTPPGDGEDPLLGQQVGSFRLLQQLGVGGMGAVYLGEHPTIGSKVAIKFLLPHFASDPRAIQRFYAEARAANLASHEGIVRVLDIGQHPSRGYYLVMEYLDGETLAARLHRGPVTVESACEILAQVASALGHAHQRGVIHRDLKPENVFLLRGGPAIQVKVMDFGIAKLKRPDSATAVNASGILGTPTYMAPEQVEGTSLDARCDVYALGVIAYELLTGRVPFEGTIPAVMMAHLRQLPPAPSARCPELDPAWDQLVQRAMAKRPEERFRDMRELAEAVEAARARQRTAQTRRAKGPARLGVTLAASGRSGAPTRLEATELTKGGAFVCCAGAPPALFERVLLTFDLPDGPVSSAADVVRHVSAAEAASWKMEPGFGVQFIKPPPALLAFATQGASASAKPGLDAEAARLVARHRTQLAANHYDLLGVPLDAPASEVTRIGAERLAELRGLLERPHSEDDRAQIALSIARVQAAMAELCSPLDRLRYDAARGNYLGVACALERGVARPLVEREHRDFLAKNPAVTRALAELLANIDRARRMGETDAAVRQVQVALTLDPLNLELHDLYRLLQDGMAAPI